MADPDYTHCRWCDYRWMGLPLGMSEHNRRGDRMPGMGEGSDLICPQCGLGGSAVVVYFPAQPPLELGPDPAVYKYQRRARD